MCENCECAHILDYGACPSFERGRNGRCVYCDHAEGCHPGTGEYFNGPLGPIKRDLVHVCEYPGCKEIATICCEVPGTEDGEEFEYLCVEHAKEEGYCWGCGQFWAGNEQFDFNPDGLCPNCEYEVGDLDEWDEGWFDVFDGWDWEREE